MTLEIQIPALIFPVVSLLFIALKTGFLGLAAVTRTLLDRYKAAPTPEIEAQIANLMLRIKLIRLTQILGVMSVAFATASMMSIFYGFQVAGVRQFVAALVLLLVAFSLYVIETYISVDAISLEFQTAKASVSKRRES